jgi:hypothetical protein
VQTQRRCRWPEQTPWQQQQQQQQQRKQQHKMPVSRSCCQCRSLSVTAALLQFKLSLDAPVGALYPVILVPWDAATHICCNASAWAPVPAHHNWHGSSSSTSDVAAAPAALTLHFSVNSIDCLIACSTHEDQRTTSTTVACCPASSAAAAATARLQCMLQMISLEVDLPGTPTLTGGVR